MPSFTRPNMLPRRFVNLGLSAVVVSVLLLLGHGPAKSQVTTPPYQDQLLRLSELIGSIHFLSLVCRPDDPQVWYDKMQEILKVEGTSTLQRARLVERFNSGFKGFQSVYRQCSPSAETLLNQYLAEGEEIVDELTTEFAG